MSTGMMQDRWAQMRREAQQRWNRLSDDDPDRPQGPAHKAQQQVDRFMRDYGGDVQARANTWLATVREFIGDNPWAAIAIGVLLIGAIAGLKRNRDR